MGGEAFRGYVREKLSWASSGKTRNTSFSPKIPCVVYWNVAAHWMSRCCWSRSWSYLEVEPPNVVWSHVNVVSWEKEGKLVTSIDS